jgi:hypothetical protein
MQFQLKPALHAGALSLLLLPATAIAQANNTRAGDGQDSVQDASAGVTTSGKFRLSTGFSYSRGDYGETEDTEVFAIPVSLSYVDGPLKVRVSMPWVRIDGPGSLLSTPEGRDNGFGGSEGSQGGSGSNSGSGSGSSGIEVEDEDDGDLIDDEDILDGGSGDDGSGGDDDSSGGSDDDGLDDSGSRQPASLAAAAAGGGAALVDNRRSGIGDISVAATYSFDLGSDFYFEPTVKVKLPTASRKKRLGTRKFDVTLSADLVKEIGNASVYVHGRRKFAGKPGGSTIRSTWGAGAGTSLALNSNLLVGVDYDWQQSAFAGRRGSSEVTGWANIRLSAPLSLTVYAIAGLNRNSADAAGGATLSLRF